MSKPAVTIEIGNETLQVKASIAKEPEATRLYNKMVEMMAGFAKYRQNTKRIIPVIVLTPIK